MGGFGVESLALQAASMVAGQRQASKAAKAQAAQAEAQVSAQNAYWQQQEDVKAKQQRDLLQHQLAATRARLAAGGIGASGSGQALMAGMVRNSEEAASDSQALLDTRISNASSTYSSASPGSGSGLLQGLALARQGLNLFGSLQGRE